MAGKARGGGLGMTVVTRALTLIACSRPEAATPGRATLGETGQEPPEDLAHKPIPAAQPTDILPIAAIPGPAEPKTMASTG